jgi:2'-5' RNA ligase
MRTFIALPVEPSQELRHILRRGELMGRAIKPVRAGQMHLTLKFLGEIASEQVAEVADAIVAACAGHSATSMTLAGLGVFPDRRRPAVLWAGVRDAAPLIALEESLSSRLELLGHPRERRAYHPHLTLARINARPPAEFFDLLNECPIDAATAPVWGTLPVDRIVLYESQRTPSGYNYVTMATHVLDK